MEMLRWPAFALAILCTLHGGAAGAAPNGAASAARLPVDPAPAVTMKRLRYAATEIFETLLKRLPLADRQRLTGAYLAFEDTGVDIGAMIGCDDDGDYVVVVTDALLRLATFIAKAEAADETCGTQKVGDYARFLAETSRRGFPETSVRPLPPPFGFFDACEAQSATRQSLEAARLLEMIAGILAHELAHWGQGDLVCANPTATHEHGDDEWTREERERALAKALERYTPSRVLSADREATTLLLDSGLTERGSLAWLKTVDRIERAVYGSSAGKETRAPPTYLRLHTQSEARAEEVRASADRWRRTH